LELSGCYGDNGPNYDPNNVFCSFIQRYAVGTPDEGTLHYPNSKQFNISTLKTNGFDLQASYNYDMHAYGKLLTSLMYTHTYGFTQTAFPGATPANLLGSIGYPMNAETIDLLYTNGPAQMSWRTRVVGKQCFFGAPCTDGLD